MPKIASKNSAKKSKSPDDFADAATWLTISDRVIRTASWAMPIVHVTGVEVSRHERTVTDPVSLWAKLAVSALPLLLAGAAFYFVLNGQGSSVQALAMALAGISFSTLIWILMSRRGRRRVTVHKLTIATSDGQRIAIAREQQAVIEKLWQELTDRMEALGPREPVTVSLDPDTADPREIAGVQPRTSDLATSALPPREGAAATAMHVSATPANGRAQSIDGAFAAASASASGASQAASPLQAVISSPADAFVDFSRVLPAIVEMHRFYARQPGALHLEQRLSELELLMRAGTPTLSQKSRLRELAVDMSQILQAYPQAVQLFDHVGDMAA